VQLSAFITISKLLVSWYQILYSCRNSVLVIKDSTPNIFGVPKSSKVLHMNGSLSLQSDSTVSSLRMILLVTWAQTKKFMSTVFTMCFYQYFAFFHAELFH